MSKPASISLWSSLIAFAERMQVLSGKKNFPELTARVLFHRITHPHPKLMIQLEFDSL